MHAHSERNETLGFLLRSATLFRLTTGAPRDLLDFSRGTKAAQLPKLLGFRAAQPGSWPRSARAQAALLFELARAALRSARAASRFALRRVARGAVLLFALAIIAQIQAVLLFALARFAVARINARPG